MLLSLHLDPRVFPDPFSKQRPLRCDGKNSPFGLVDVTAKASGFPKSGTLLAILSQSIQAPSNLSVTKPGALFMPPARESATFEPMVMKTKSLLATATFALLPFLRKCSFSTDLLVLEGLKPTSVTFTPVWISTPCFNNHRSIGKTMDS